MLLASRLGMSGRSPRDSARAGRGRSGALAKVCQYFLIFDSNQGSVNRLEGAVSTTAVQAVLAMAHHRPQTHQCWVVSYE